MRFEFDKLDIGDVMVVRTKYKGSFFVRLAAKLKGKSNKVDHVLIVHHRDENGTLWGIQGAPGSVGWTQVERWRGDPYANANVEQPKTREQREKIARYSEGMLKTKYDWAGIVLDGMHFIGADILWNASEWKDGIVPAQVVCSSFADYLYEVVQLANPGGDKRTRGTDPADWDDFITSKGWNA